MNYFAYKDNRLFVEEVAISDLAARFGTPFYVYSTRTLRRHYRVMDEAFAGTDHLICYAMKALSNLSVLKLFAARTRSSARWCARRPPPAARSRSTRSRTCGATAPRSMRTLCAA